MSYLGPIWLHPYTKELSNAIFVLFFFKQKIYIHYLKWPRLFFSFFFMWERLGVYLEITYLVFCWKFLVENVLKYTCTFFFFFFFFEKVEKYEKKKRGFKKIVCEKGSERVVISQGSRLPSELLRNSIFVNLSSMWNLSFKKWYTAKYFSNNDKIIIISKNSDIWLFLPIKSINTFIEGIKKNQWTYKYTFMKEIWLLVDFNIIS